MAAVEKGAVPGVQLAQRSRRQVRAGGRQVCGAVCIVGLPPQPSVPGSRTHTSFVSPGPRVESIMVSAPPLVAWRYNVQPAPGSEEERLERVLRQPQEWV